MQSLQWGAGMLITKHAVYKRATLEVPARRVEWRKCHQWLRRFGWWHLVYQCGISEPGAGIKLVYRGIAKSGRSACCITAAPYMVTSILTGCVTSPGCAGELFPDGKSTQGYDELFHQAGFANSVIHPRCIRVGVPLKIYRGVKTKPCCATMPITAGINKPGRALRSLHWRSMETLRWMFATQDVYHRHRL